MCRKGEDSCVIHKKRNSGRFRTYISFLCARFSKKRTETLSDFKKIDEPNIGELQILYDDKIWVGYAFLIVQKNQRVVLLEYLAIRDGMRSRGYGEKLIAKIKDSYRTYDALFGEVERVEHFLPESLNQLRIRRIRFYERLGFELMNNYVIRLWDVNYVPVYVTTKEKISHLKMASYIESFYDLFYGSYFKTEEDYHRCISFYHK